MSKLIMRTINVQLILTISALTSSGLCSLSYADSDYNAGQSCSQLNKTTGENTFWPGLNDLLTSLAANAPLHGGFYKSAAGQGSSKVYGVVQCRGDLSVNDCANCSNRAIAEARHECPNSKRVTIWHRWCFLSYSDENFFGKVDGASVGFFNETDYEIPSVAPKGITFMSELTTTAPEQPSMFQVAVLDVGENGKRYGMAQCRRDISKSNCAKCLDDQMVAFSTMVGNKRGWEIFGSGCNMGYHDYQFYSNISDLANTNSNGNWRTMTTRDATTVTVVVLTLLIFL